MPYMEWGSLAFEPADERRCKAPAKRWKLPALAVEQLTKSASMYFSFLAIIVSIALVASIFVPNDRSMGPLP